jgi:signal transduction histidine kinase
MDLSRLKNSFRVRLLLLLAVLLVLTLGVQYYVGLRAVRGNAQLIVEQQRAIMAGVALGVNSISSNEYLDQMRKEANQPLLDEQSGRVKNILVVTDEGDIFDSLDKTYAPTTAADNSKHYMQLKDVSLPTLRSAVRLATDEPLPAGMTVGHQVKAGDPAAFYFPIETEKGRWYIIVVLGSASSMTNLLERQARQSLFYTLAVLLVTTALTAIVVWRFTRPIKYLSTAARRVAAGDFSFRVPAAKGRDEMGELTNLFNEMTVKLGRAHELETHLHETEKAAVVGRLASAIAHEIRNPLNYINLTLDHLRTSFSPQDPAQREKFEALTVQLKSEVARINARITEFLNYSRPPKLELRPVDLYATVNDALSMVAAQAAETGIATEVEKRSEVPNVTADPEAIRSAITNLIINALQAIDGGRGKLTITLAREDDGRRARIEITDTGRGIAPEDIAKVFEPYYSTKETGTGLGLAITRKVVDDHGGTISVKSKVGEGTTFVITLPTEPSGTEPPALTSG